MDMLFKRLFSLIFIFSTLYFSVFTPVFALTQEEQEAQWRAELAQTEADIAKWQAILNSTKADTASLQQEAKLLNAKIQQAKALIKQKNIAIAQLETDISKKKAHISTLEQQIEDGHESMAQLVRKTNELDSYTLPEVVLGNQDLSDFFSDVDTFQSVNRSLANLFTQIREKKDLTEKEKAALDKQKDKEADTKAAAEVQQKKVQADEKEKEYLIAVNKTQEKTYAQVLAERQAKAAEIRAKLFKLAGGSAAIPFGTALTYAQAASDKTGVSPAFVLAILTQESNLGANVGKCYLTDATTGYGVNINTGKTWTNLMKASRDVPPFIEITGKLGFDPYKTVVSCPIPSAGGYGGAMGPAQFIASTWKLLESRLQSELGHFPNPWNPQDAFMASATYLSDLGAGSGTYSGEMRAACKYYGSGGSSCSYGKSVMTLKNSIQADIEYLAQYGISRR
jgi:peptidoglycan hydrolase CwlO-like protein